MYWGLQMKRWKLPVKDSHLSWKPHKTPGQLLAWDLYLICKEPEQTCALLHKKYNPTETGKSFFIREKHHLELIFSVKDDFQGLLAIHYNQKYGLKYINYSLLYSNALVPPLEIDLVTLQVWLESWWGLVWQGALLLLSTKVKHVAKVSWEMLVLESFLPSNHYVLYLGPHIK